MNDNVSKGYRYQFVKQSLTFAEAFVSLKTKESVYDSLEILRLASFKV